MTENINSDFEREIQETINNDKLYPLAVNLVKESKRASISFLQRKLTIGYNRAARIMEAMEHQNIVSVPAWNGSREVLTEGEI